MAPRYAVYFSPEPGSPLDAFGHRWLGRNDQTPAKSRTMLPVVAGMAPARVAALTESAWRYGFHATLKPPFELNPASSLDAFLAAAHIFAKGLAPIELPALELAIIGKFIALTPVASSATLENFAAQCVRVFEGFRVPLTPEQTAHYMRYKLTVHQTQMLEHWGYPYVMEEFRFHISITDRIDDEKERAAMLSTVQALAGDVVNKPIVVRDLAVFHQPERDMPMMLLERIPFGRVK
jgi:putative phosphonate metabolism protein